MHDLLAKIIIGLFFFSLYLYFKRNTLKALFPAKPPTAKSVADRSNDDVYHGYIALVDLLIHDSEKPALRDFIGHIHTKYSSSENEPGNYASAYLYEIDQYLESRGTTFIHVVDWKMSIRDVIWNITKGLGERVKRIPTFTTYDEQIGISAVGAFADLNKHLNSTGIQMASINNGSDAYRIILFETKALDKVKHAVSKIGLPLELNIE